MDPKQLREHIIRPVLEGLDLYTDAALELVFGTACQESHLKYVKQLGSGPAVGLFQMEPATHDDIWANYLAYKRPLADKVLRFELPDLYEDNNAQEMAGNLYYAAAMCRIHYLRVPKALPAANDVVGLAEYWKQYYNTPLGAGTEQEFIENYARFWDV
jgi:hypothetical protein